MKDNKKYDVYELLFPDGTVYVGITSVTLKKRAGKNGSRYSRHPFYPKIQFFGWDNIEANIIEFGLDKQSARDMEKMLIEEYRSQGISLNASKGGETGDCSELFELDGKMYTSEQLVEMSSVKGLTTGILASRINRHGWTVERAITQPTNKKLQPFNLGEKKYELDGSFYSSYELCQISPLNDLKSIDITDRINHHGWSVEKAITQPKRRSKVKYPYKGGKYSAKELAELSPVEGLSQGNIRDRIKSGWTVDEAVNTPLKPE